ncbi:MAG TPA: GTPase Era [Acidobacteriaceae bacterium]|nr:GTPase Era [Acidobacteriaceae bacterium]
MKMRSGFVSVIGRPNAGKSTLVNALVGERVAIVTSKPQTTRTRIHGMVEVPERKGVHPAAQIVFVDTPGIHQGRTQLDRSMMQQVHEALQTRDVVLLVIDAVRRRPGSEDEILKLDRASEEALAFEMIRDLDCPVFLVITKVDLIAKERLLPLIEGLSKLHDFAEVIPVSAKKGDGLRLLLHKIAEHLPEGRRWFPRDQFTDQPERFLVAELIRERVLMETGEEVPYASAVVVERFEEPEVTPPLRGRKAGSKLPVTRISAAIYCERPGQKAILIGKGGSKLKEIGAGARQAIEAMLGTRVYLELHVLVRENWRDSRVFVESLDWRKQLQDIAARETRNTE